MPSISPPSQSAPASAPPPNRHPLSCRRIRHVRKLTRKYSAARVRENGNGRWGIRSTGRFNWTAMSRRDATTRRRNCIRRGRGESREEWWWEKGRGAEDNLNYVNETSGEPAKRVADTSSLRHRENNFFKMSQRIGYVALLSEGVYTNSTSKVVDKKKKQQRHAVRVCSSTFDKVGHATYPNWG